MKIAIVGRGMCGLACAVHLLEKKNQGLTPQITLFDPSPLGENASGIAAGLLHPFAGARAKLVRYGKEGMQATLALVSIAENALGSSVAKKTGFLRLAITDGQKQDFKICSEQNKSVHWLQAEQCLEKYPLLAPHPGIFIEDCYTFDTYNYLLGLWKYCEAKGVIWEQAKIESLNRLSKFDKIIIASGAETLAIKELAHLPLRRVKGQLLEILWPEDIPPLSFPINSRAYLVMSEDGQTCILGATFEKDFSSPLPDEKKAWDDLAPKLRELIPDFPSCTIMDCRAGMRSSAPKHLPFIGKINDKTIVIAGMGSKGYLYHALFAKNALDKL